MLKSYSGSKSPSGRIRPPPPGLDRIDKPRDSYEKQTRNSKPVNKLAIYFYFTVNYQVNCSEQFILSLYLVQHFTNDNLEAKPLQSLNTQSRIMFSNMPNTSVTREITNNSAHLKYAWTFSVEMCAL